MVEGGAVLRIICPIPHDVLRRHQADGIDPVPCFLCPIRIGGVSRIGSQTRAQLKEAAIGNRVLVIVAVVKGKDLPTKAATTCLRSPAGRLRVEDGLSKSKPLWLI